MVNDRQRLRTIEKSNRESTTIVNHQKRSWLRWRWSHVRAPGTFQETNAFVSRTTTTKTNEYYDKASKSTQNCLDDDHQQRQTGQSNQQSTRNWHYLRWWDTRLGKCHRRICSTRGAIDAQSLHANRTRLTKLTGFLLFVFRNRHRKNDQQHGLLSRYSNNEWLFDLLCWSGPTHSLHLRLRSFVSLVITVLFFVQPRFAESRLWWWYFCLSCVSMDNG